MMQRSHVIAALFALSCLTIPATGEGRVPFKESPIKDSVFIQLSNQPSLPLQPSATASVNLNPIISLPRNKHLSALVVHPVHKLVKPVVPAKPIHRISPKPRKSAPRPAPVIVRTSHGVAGIASWYCVPGKSACQAAHPYGGLYAAAGPALRTGQWMGRLVKVCLSRQPSTCVTVRLTDWCQCYLGRRDEKAIDLYGDAFRSLAPLSSGVVSVRIYW